MESRSLADTLRLFATELRGAVAREPGAAWRSLLAPGRISPETALSVYRGNSLAVFEGALAELYPAVRVALGPENFTRAAATFARRFPATTPDLNGYGAEFADFLGELPGLEPFPFLGPLARLDRVMHDLYYASGDDDDPEFVLPTVNSIFSAIAAGKPENTALRLTRPAVLFAADIPVHRLRALLLSDAGAGAAELSLAAQPAPTRLIVFRRAHDLLIHETPAFQWDALRAIAGACSIAELDALLQTGAGDPELSAGAIASTLAGMIKAGWIGGVVGI